MDRILICDSTLRDGEQSPDAGMTVAQKVKLGQALIDLGVDIVEAGFAKTSVLDAQVIYDLAQQVQGKRTVISSLARCCAEDIELAAKVLAPAISCHQGRIHLFVATSDQHIENKLNKTRSQILTMIHDSVAYAKKWTADVQWSAEDATRSDTEFLIQCAQTAIDAGATTINFADTVGQMVDTQMQTLYETVLPRLSYGPSVVFAAHCHNDKGLATANSLFAIKGGARQIDCCMNGLGERAGNAALEEVVMAIKSTPEVYPYMLQVDPKKLRAVSHMVADFSGFAVAPNKAIVGKNAFLHAAGVHQDGVLSADLKGLKSMYSSIDSDLLGCQNDIVITRHSGCKAVMYMLQKQGVEATPQLARAVLQYIKHQTAHPKHFSADELVALSRQCVGD